MTWRVQPAFVAATGAAVVLMVASPLLGLVAAAAVTLTALREALVLRRTIGRTLYATTRRALASGEE